MRVSLILSRDCYLATDSAEVHSCVTSGVTSTDDHYTLASVAVRVSDEQICHHKQSGTINIVFTTRTKYQLSQPAIVVLHVATVLQDIFRDISV